MTRATTPVKPERPRPFYRQPLTLFVVGSIVLHLALIPVLRPLLVSEQRFDLAEEQSRTQEVTARELARQQREHERREKLALDEQTARRLEAEAERRKRDELLEQVTALEASREQMEEMRQEALKQIEQRDRQAMIERELAKMAEEKDGLQDDIHDLANTDDKNTGDNEKAKAEHNALRESLAKLGDAAKPESSDQTEGGTDAADDESAKQSAPDPQAVAEAAREAAEKAQQLAESMAETEAREGNSDRRDLEAGNAKRHARRLAEMAANLEQIAQGKPNDTSTTEGDGEQDRQLRAEAQRGESRSESATELYDRAKALEASMNRASRDLRAAELAMTTNRSFREAQSKLTDQSPHRPDLARKLEGEASRSVGELNEFREALQQAVGETRDMATRSRGMVAQAGGQTAARRSEDAATRMARQNQLARYARQSGALVDLTGVTGGGISDGRGGGGTEDDGALDDSAQGPGMNTVFQSEGVALPQSHVLQHAMPGRMFTDDSGRTGWLYLDTWYVIGPWENNRDIDFNNIHPPEYEIDFDAVYTSGKYADQPDHPDHEMRWQFMQASHIRNQPPKVHPAATYYAYTEVYSDRARDVLISIGIDAAGRLWVNDDLVWEAPGRSGWRLGEAFRKVRLQRGYNTILARVENGSGSCVWSVLLCPPEVVRPEKD